MFTKYRIFTNFFRICKDAMLKKSVNVHLHSVPYEKTTAYAKVVRELELSVKLSHKNVKNVHKYLLIINS